MPGFREWIENKRKREFFEALGKVAGLGLAVIGSAIIVSGIIGAPYGSSKRI
jgi:hypothetical protein